MSYLKGSCKVIQLNSILFFIIKIIQFIRIHIYYSPIILLLIYLCTPLIIDYFFQTRIDEIPRK